MSALHKNWCENIQWYASTVSLLFFFIYQFMWISNWMLPLLLLFTLWSPFFSQPTREQQTDGRGDFLLKWEFSGREKASGRRAEKHNRDFYQQNMQQPTGLPFPNATVALAVESSDILGKLNSVSAVLPPCWLPSTQWSEHRCYHTIGIIPYTTIALESYHTLLDSVTVSLSYQNPIWQWDSDTV